MRLACLAISLLTAACIPARAEDAPDLTVEYVSGFAGYVEPCRCNSGVLGGLPRRFTYLKQLRAERPNTLCLFGGDVYTGPGLEAQLKGETSLSFLRMAHYDAVLPGDADLRYGAKALRSAAASGLPLLCANPPAKAGLGAVAATATYQFGVPGRPRPVRVGVTAVLGNGLVPSDAALGLEPTDATLAAKRAVAQIRRQADYVILLAHMDLPDALRLADAVPAADLVIAAHVGSLVTQEPIVRGNALVVANGDRGRYGTHLDIWFGPGMRLVRFRNVAVPLDSSLRDDPEAAAIVLAMKRKLAAAVEAMSPRATDPSPYAGAAECAGCHEPQAKQWSRTPHASAFALLQRGQEGLDASQPECLLCHTVGFGAQGGYVNKARTPQLRGVQCESCHGPGRAHVQAARAGRPHTGDIARAVPRTACVKCHTAEKSPGFNYERSLASVRH